MGDSLEMVGHLMDTGEEIAQTLLRSPEKDIFKSVKLFLELFHEMEGHRRTFKEETAQTQFRSPKRDLPASGELYSADRPLSSGHRRERLYMVTIEVSKKEILESVRWEMVLK